MPFFIPSNRLNGYISAIVDLKAKLAETEAAMAQRIAASEARAAALDQKESETRSALLEQSGQCQAARASLAEVQQERDRLLTELHDERALTAVVRSESAAAVSALEAAALDARQERDRLLAELQEERERARAAAGESLAALQVAEASASYLRQELDRLVAELEVERTQAGTMRNEGAAALQIAEIAASDARRERDSIVTEIAETRLQAAEAAASAQRNLSAAHCALGAIATSRTYIASRTSEAIRANGLRQRVAQALLTSADGERLARKAIFTLHKTASMFVWELCDYLAATLNIPIRSPNGLGPEYIYDEIKIQDHISDVDWSLGIYGPFRGAFNFDENVFERILINLRDPRDILTSMYYSWAYSHPIIDDRPTLVGPDGRLFNPLPEQREKWKINGIDNFVIEYSDFIEKNIRIYLEKYIRYPRATVIFYEEMLSNPEAWLTKALAALGASMEDARLLARYVQADLADHFAPVEENVNNHRRQGAPGDHARKLRPDTIAELNKRFSFYFEFAASQGDGIQA